MHASIKIAYALYMHFMCTHRHQIWFDINTPLQKIEWKSLPEPTMTDHRTSLTKFSEIWPKMQHHSVMKI